MTKARLACFVATFCTLSAIIRILVDTPRGRLYLFAFCVALSVYASWSHPPVAEDVSLWTGWYAR